MLEALVSTGTTVRLHTATIPTPGPSDVLIKVIVAGSNPKDWKLPEWNPNRSSNTNQGDDIAGVVDSVGSDVFGFKPGDRVAAFHRMETPGGAWAEYAIAPEHTTFHIPATTSFEEAATIPLAAMTAVVGLFARLGLPEPWNANEETLPKGGLVVYGGASAVGAFTIKLAQRVGIHPIITVAGRGVDFVEKLIDKSKGDIVIDYRQENEKIVEQIRAAVPKDQKLLYAFDAVSEKVKSSYDNICQVLEPQGGKLTIVLPIKQDYSSIPATVKRSNTLVGSVHTDGSPDRELAKAWFDVIALGLKEGWFSGHPYEVVPGGLAGVESALKNLKEGQASAVKYVFRIADTAGVSSTRDS